MYRCRSSIRRRVQQFRLMLNGVFCRYKCVFLVLHINEYREPQECFISCGLFIVAFGFGCHQILRPGVFNSIILPSPLCHSPHSMNQEVR